MDTELHEFVQALVHAYVPGGEPDSPQQLARTVLAALLTHLWAAVPEYPPPVDVRACIAEAEAAARQIAPDFRFDYDPLLVGIKPFDWSALAA